jgi:hypothetical protein
MRVDSHEFLAPALRPALVHPYSFDLGHVPHHCARVRVQQFGSCLLGRHLVTGLSFSASSSALRG